MLASGPASILNHNRRPLGILSDSISADYALEAVEAWEITVHRTFSDFDDFWMTKVKVPSLAPQSPRWHPETSRRSRAGCAHAYRRHRRTDHARSLEYCCLMRDFTEDDATMQERFAMRAPLDDSRICWPAHPWFIAGGKMACRSGQKERTSV